MVPLITTDVPLGVGDLERVLVIIPVFNEADTIAKVIQQLQAQGLTQIRVVDNNSDDGSGDIARRWGAGVVRETVTGYGSTCWRGLQNIPESIEWILFCDGDGSDDLSQLPNFWAATATADFILSNRRAVATSRQKLTPAQNWGNGLAVTLIQWGWGFQYQDLGPLRLIRRTALEKIAMQDRAFGWTVEMQVRAVEEGLRIQEIATSYGDRQGGQSKISGTLSGVIKAGYGILTTIGKLYWRKWQQRNRAAEENVIPWQQSLIVVLAGILLLLGAGMMHSHGDFSHTSSFRQFCLGFGVMVAGWAGASFGKLPRSMGVIWFWAVAIGCRLWLLPMTPGDDIWRYLWEGWLQNQGFNPYGLPPNAPPLEFLRPDWWSAINHPDIAAIYPPVTQWGFRLLAAIDPSVFVFKLGFVAADLGVCALLAIAFGVQRAKIYAWNPLVIYSFAGGGHYDSWFILPLVAAWLLVEKRHWGLSALFLGISIGVKWISLPLFGFWLWRRRPQQWPGLLLFAGLPLLLTAPTFCRLDRCPLIPAQSSFVVQARSADLLPHILTYFWPASRQMNWIFVLPLAVITGILLLRCRQFTRFAEGYFIVLFLLSPVIHAWYFTWLIPFAVATGNWGTRWLTASSLIYFWLPYRQFAGLETERWFLTNPERTLLWLPFLVGCGWTWLNGRPSLHLSSLPSSDLLTNSERAKS